MVVHSKPGERKSWAYYGKEGFYIGPAFHHYRCIEVFMPDTHATRFTDTARMIPDKIPIPHASLDDHLRATAEHLIKLIINKKKPIGPHVQSPTKQELLRLATVLKRDTTPPLKNLPILPTSELSLIHI